MALDEGAAVRLHAWITRYASTIVVLAGIALTTPIENLALSSDVAYT
jgi:hypothetical protein